MTKEERKAIYDQAEEIWGKVAQYDQAVEEMGELIVAINKFKRKCLHGEYQESNRVEENLVEELADVKMCIEQLSMYVGEDRVETMLDAKLQKLQDLMEMMRNKRG